MNVTRRASQSDYHALESYVSSSPAKIIYSKELSILNKLYKNEEKFENTEDNFDFKLIIYLDKCKYADLSEHAYEKDVSLMLTNETLTYYYANRDNFITFNDFCISMRLYFESSEWRDQNLDKWHTITFENVVTINSNVSLIECFRKMCSQMNTIQRDLNPAYHDSIRLRKNIIRICRSHSALIYEIINSSMKIFALMNTLQSSIISYEVIRKSFTSQQYHQNEDEANDHYFIDKQYRRDESSYDRRDESSYDRRDESSSDRRVEFYRDEFRDRSNDKFSNRRFKKCFVCDKFDCWSINHSDKKREDSKKRFSDRFSQFRNNNRLNQYICEYESTDEDDDHDEMIQYFEKHSISIISASISTIISATSSTNINALLIEFESNKLFLISVDELRNIEFGTITSLLANQTFKHRLIAENCIIITALINELFSFISTTESRYDDHEFKDILMNCETAELSTDDIEQFKVLKRISNDVKLNTKTVESNIKFEIDSISILSTVALNISLERIIFHIVEVNISFLLSLIDLNRLKMYFNNLINEMIQKIFDLQISSKIRRHSVIRRYDHAFLLWKIFTYSLIAEFIDENSCLLTEIELRRLHRRFDHLSARRLYEILTRSDHDNVESRVIEHLNKYCHHCQMHEKSSERFSFSIRNSDSEFNFNILMNILYIETKEKNKPVLHLVNEVTRFQVDRWLKDISARHVWDQFRTCWIDTYLRSSDVIIADSDKQFVSREFKSYAGNMSIIVKIVSIETHHSIEMMKRYHELLRRTYLIITIEISEINSELALQMTFKVINDSIELNDLISTLLVFDVYFRMIEMNVSSFTIIQRTIAMKKTMNEVRKLHAIRQINDALNIKNDPISLIHNLSLNSLVLIFRESNTGQSGSWKEPFKLLSIQKKSAIIELSNESIKFRSISVKSYYQDDQDEHADDENSSSTSISSMIELSNISSFIEFENDHLAIDSLIRTLIHHEPFASSSKRDSDRSRKYLASTAYLNFILNSITADSSFIASR
jgi:hypothetical protein